MLEPTTWAKLPGLQQQLVLRGARKFGLKGALLECDSHPEVASHLLSKFIPEGSQRVGLVASRESKKTALEYTAFVRPDGAVAVVVLNRWVLQVRPRPTGPSAGAAGLTALFCPPRSPQDITFGLADTVGLIAAVAPANSIQTYLWRRQ